MPANDLSITEEDLMSLTDFTAIRQEAESAFVAMAWAEAEIGAAQRRHPAAADELWHSFTLLKLTQPRLRTEAMCRAHCRELLDRVARGEDTRPGTAAECCIALSNTTLAGPLDGSGAGLYLRMWRTAGLPPVTPAGDDGAYEALYGSRITEHEIWLRQTLRQDWRVLPDAVTSAAARRR